MPTMDDIKKINKQLTNVCGRKERLGENLDKTVEELCELAVEIQKYKSNPSKERLRKIESEYAHVMVQFHIIQPYLNAERALEEYRSKAQQRIESAKSKK